MTERRCNRKFYKEIEARIGRKLLKTEVVHHIDLDRQNNAPENLQVMTRTEHLALHRSMRTSESMRQRQQIAAQANLVAALEAKRQSLGLSQIPFGALLGISQGHWSTLKNGQRGIGPATAQRILKAFPDLWREVRDAIFHPEESAA